MLCLGILFCPTNVSLIYYGYQLSDFIRFLFAMCVSLKVCVSYAFLLAHSFLFAYLFCLTQACFYFTFFINFLKMSVFLLVF